MQQQTITQAQMDEIKKRALPVLGVLTYGTDPTDPDKAMVHVWVEVDPTNPDLSQLRECMATAMEVDGYFDVEQSITADYPATVSLATCVPLWWNFTFTREALPFASFSFPLLLPLHAMEIAAIADDGFISICPMPPGSILTQRVKEQQAQALEAARRTGLAPDVDFPIPAHYHFSANAETVLMVDGFTVEVPDPDGLIDAVVLFYEMAGVDMGVVDSTGQSWGDILRNGDVHFSQAC